MDCFVSPSRFVAFDQVQQVGGPQVSPNGDRTLRGYGLSLPSIDSRVTRSNCWYMTDRLVGPADVAAAGHTIYLGSASAVFDPIAMAPLRSDSEIDRTQFLTEMRRMQHDRRARNMLGDCWVESHLRAYVHEKPELTEPFWPTRPSVAPSGRKRQIDTGTIGLAIPTPDEVLHVGEIHVDNSGGIYSEIWVLSEAYQLHMPPGTAAAPRVVALQPSVTFAGNPPENQQDFLDRACTAFNNDMSVFLIQAVLSDDVPAS